MFTLFCLFSHLLAADFGFFPEAFARDGDKGRFPGTSVIIVVFVRLITYSKIAISSSRLTSSCGCGRPEAAMSHYSHLASLQSYTNYWPGMQTTVFSVVHIAHINSDFFIYAKERLFRF